MFDLITYCSRNYISRFSKTIGSWCDQKSVDKIYVYNDYGTVENHDSDKIISRNIFEPSTDFGINCARKALCIQHFIKNTKFDNALFIDIDCLIVRDLSGLFDEQFDVAVTIYPEVKPRHQTRNISSGFIAFKNSIGVAPIIDLWISIQENIAEERFHPSPCRDQKALSEVITEMKNNAKADIKLLNSHVYNSHPLSGGKGFVGDWLRRIDIYKPCILHFASGTIDNQDFIEMAIKASE